MLDKKFSVDEIPEGATHYNQNFAFPFEKWQSGNGYVFLMGSWDKLPAKREGTKPLSQKILNKNL